MEVPEFIEIVEVSARDGLQNEPRLFSTEEKLTLIDRATGAGIRRIEVASFVHPQRVPQMADAEAVVSGLPDRDDLTFIGLVLNEHGLNRALETKIDEIGSVSIATDSFAQKNQGQDSQRSVEISKHLIRRAKADGRRTNVTIAAAFGCPYEGEVSSCRVLEMAQDLAEAEPNEISIADSIGAGQPWQVEELITRVRQAIPDTPIRVHFHNTRNTGIANAYAAIRAGVTTIDASIGGIGGCPFVPAATGNIPTEDVVHMLERQKISTGTSLEHLIQTANWLAEKVDRVLPGMVSRVGRFPPSHH